MEVRFFSPNDKINLNNFQYVSKRTPIICLLKFNEVIPLHHMLANSRNQGPCAFYSRHARMRYFLLAAQCSRLLHEFPACTQHEQNCIGQHVEILVNLWISCLIQYFIEDYKIDYRFSIIEIMYLYEGRKTEYIRNAQYSLEHGSLSYRMHNCTYCEAATFSKKNALNCIEII